MEHTNSGHRKVNRSSCVMLEVALLYGLLSTIPQIRDMSLTQYQDVISYTVISYRPFHIKECVRGDGE